MTSFITYRGFTDHEMLDPFGLVNMNGRMYDPLLGRMLSPDNYVQSPGSTQGFNRYSYALNNPLVYTDPSGEMPFLVALGYMAVQGIIAGDMAKDTKQGFAGGFAYGFASAGLSQGVGALIGPVMAGTGAIPGLLNAGVNAAVSGTITYGFDAIVNNSPYNWKGWALNVGMAMAVGGVEGYANGLEYNNLVGPRPYGQPTSINPLTGQPNLDEKLRIALFFHYDDIYKEFGETGVSEVIAASKKNLKGNKYIEAKGDLIYIKSNQDYPDGSFARGAHIRGRAFGLTNDGYIRFDMNKIYLSRYTVRKLFNGGDINAVETLYHEFFHANDWYEGNADWLYQINGGRYNISDLRANTRMNAMLEFRAHSYNFSSHPTSYRTQMMKKYATRYWSLFD